MIIKATRIARLNHNHTLSFVDTKKKQIIENIVWALNQVQETHSLNRLNQWALQSKICKTFNVNNHSYRDTRINSIMDITPHQDNLHRDGLPRLGWQRQPQRAQHHPNTSIAHRQAQARQLIAVQTRIKNHRHQAISYKWVNSQHREQNKNSKSIHIHKWIIS